jgi:hypothetical protein
MKIKKKKLKKRVKNFSIPHLFLLSISYHTLIFLQNKNNPFYNNKKMEEENNSTTEFKNKIKKYSIIAFCGFFAALLIRNLRREQSKLYFERQEGNNCFIHATNHYFQQKYLTNSFIDTYLKKIYQNETQIKKFKDESINSTFYPSLSVPKQNELIEDNSDPKFNDDLFNYYQVNSFMYFFFLFFLLLFKLFYFIV